MKEKKVKKIKIKPIKITYTTLDGKIYTDKIDEVFLLPEKTKRIKKGKI